MGASERISRLQARMADEGIGALCVRDTANIAYLTGFRGVFDSEQAHALLIDSAQALLHTDSRYDSALRSAASQAGSEVEVVCDGLLHTEWLAQMPDMAELAIEDTVTVSELRKLESKLGDATAIRETSGLVGKLRTVKDAQEIELMKAVQEIADKAYIDLVPRIEPGWTERQVQRELDNLMLAHGADGPSFPTIAAFGANAANPHAQPTDAKLEAGQCLLLDFGASAFGYCSDTTRMVFLGVPDDGVRYAYEVLCEANEKAAAALYPGVTGAAAHQVAIDVLAEKGFPDAMGHSLGHGVGMEVHEGPALSPRNEEALVAGNVVTVEPGIYVEGVVGMRLEDCGVVTDEGYQAFSRIPHNMVII